MFSRQKLDIHWGTLIIGCLHIKIVLYFSKKVLTFIYHWKLETVLHIWILWLIYTNILIPDMHKQSDFFLYWLLVEEKKANRISFT